MDTEIQPQTPKEIFDGLKEQLEALKHDYLDDVNVLTSNADMAVEGFHSIEEELSGLREQLVKLRAEHEALPQQAFRASMDDDAMKEQELRGRYALVREELPKLEVRVEELRYEADLLCPSEYKAAPSHGVEIRQHGPASRMATEKREQAEKLADAIRDLLDEFLEPITKCETSIRQYLHQHSEMLDRAKRGEHV